jgi:hypothetical protein
MSTAVISEDELRAAISSVFGEIPADDLQRRVVALCQGLNDSTDSSRQLDDEWVERVYPRLENWLVRLQVLENTFQERLAVFLLECQRSAVAIELFEESALKRLERTWMAISEYFESVMPDDLLGHEAEELSIDERSTTGWWTANQADPGLDLPGVVAECLQVAGEFSDESSQQIIYLFVDALCEGTAPLPGFVFEDRAGGIASWKWLSPEAEASDMTPSGHEPDTSLDDELLILFEKAPKAAAQLQLCGYLPLPDGAVAHVPALVASARSTGVSEGIVMREFGTPLLTCASRALQIGDTEQLQRALAAVTALTTSVLAGHGKTRSSRSSTS